MNREVNVTKRVQTPKGPRYCPVVLAANGRIKPNAVLINGKPEHHPEGSYYLEWREGAKRVRLAVGKDAADAGARRQRKEAEINAVNNGAAIVTETTAGHSLAGAIAAYLGDVKLTHKPRSYAAYKTALGYFSESCHKLNVEDVDRHDLLKFSAFLREEREQAPRTVYNNFEHAMTFLKAQGIRGLVGKNDWPRFTQEEPEIYEQEELKTLFAVCDGEEKLWYEFFLTTGMREQEVMHTYWSDLNFAASTVKVTHKPDRGWTPKAYREREIPIPTRLVKALKTWKTKAVKGCNLIFPTSGCKPKMNFLDDLKAVAKRAKLEPDTVWLHKFRSTFATTCLWAGIDLRTVQMWLGHTDIESTMRYLKPSRSKQTRAKVNVIWK
jgi:integrase/recombinase XerD